MRLARVARAIEELTSKPPVPLGARLRSDIRRDPRELQTTLADCSEAIASEESRPVDATNPRKQPRQGTVGAPRGKTAQRRSRRAPGRSFGTRNCERDSCSYK